MTRYLTLPFALATLACSVPTALQVPADAVALNSEDIVTFYQSSNTGMAARQRLVVRDQDAWEAAWQQLTANTMPSTSAPEVDFGAHMLIVAAMGSRPTGGFVVSVDGVHVSDAGIFVTVLETAPGPGCAVTLAFTAPAVVVRIPRNPAEVTFVERTGETACD